MLSIDTIDHSSVTNGKHRALKRDIWKGIATVLLPCWFVTVAAHFFSASLKVLSQGNLRRRSLQGPRSAATGYLRIDTVWVFVYLLWQFTFGLHVGVSTALA